MKIFLNVVLVVLALLAISSGVAKIMLMQQDVDFFSQYGFSNPILIAYGLVQLVGGLMLLLRNTRVVGAYIVIATFLVSAAILLMSGNIPVAFITLVFVALAGFVISQSRNMNNS